MLLGLAILAINGIAPIREQIITSIPMLAEISKLIITIVGAIILFIGAFLSFSGGSGGSNKQKEEVPIYEGEGKKRTVVGYRKMDKKKKK